jgi:hypothetical protein
MQSRAGPTRQRTSHTSHQRTRTHTSVTTREREGGRASSSRPRTQRHSRHAGGSTAQRGQSRAHSRPHGPSTIREEHVVQPEDSAIEEQIGNLNYIVDQHTQTFYQTNLPYVRSQIGYRIITGSVQNEVDGELSYHSVPLSHSWGVFFAQVRSIVQAFGSSQSHSPTSTDTNYRRTPSPTNFE